MHNEVAEYCKTADLTLFIYSVNILKQLDFYNFNGQTMDKTFDISASVPAFGSTNAGFFISTSLFLLYLSSQ